MWWTLAEWRQAEFTDSNGCKRMTEVLVPLTGSGGKAEMQAKLKQRLAQGRPVVLLGPEQRLPDDADVWSLPHLAEGM